VRTNHNGVATEYQKLPTQTAFNAAKVSKYNVRKARAYSLTSDCSPQGLAVTITRLLCSPCTDVPPKERRRLGRWLPGDEEAREGCEQAFVETHGEGEWFAVLSTSSHVSLCVLALLDVDHHSNLFSLTDQRSS
jgi:hypothetical protein